ncbi:Flp pilus assembly complex ATPase component TadA [bacterium]|nr:Flp pilus assembly complex ATPase component TadA [bacterium]
MHDPQRRLVLCVDDDDDYLRLEEQILAGQSLDVVCAHDAPQALAAVKSMRPDLILLDVKMPGTDGYELCARLQEDPEAAFIPVIFVTGLDDEQNRAHAFAAGGADYLAKPIGKDALVAKVLANLERSERWNRVQRDGILWYGKAQPGAFIRFREYLFNALDLPAATRYDFSKLPPKKLYDAAPALGIGASILGQHIAEYLGLPFVFDVNPGDVELGVLPGLFCRSNHVVAVRDDKGGQSFIMSNPFDLDTMDMLRQFVNLNASSVVRIADPATIDLAFTYEETPRQRDAAGVVTMPAPDSAGEGGPGAEALIREEIAGARVVAMTNNMLGVSVAERASDIHIEPKEGNTVVRFRIDGDLREFFTMPKATGVKLISRLKVLADLDIAERRLPQDGSFAARIMDRAFNLRIATTSTPYGEALVVRLLEPYSKPRSLRELGFTTRQTRALISQANLSHGFVLIVGATGSGKTTTLQCLLHQIDFRSRCVMSVEDPVEYRLPFATQQQVNEKAGLTFERLLRAIVRQDPDVLFLGEVRDAQSAQIAVDFVSTGHLTVSSLHTMNATTAFLRLERLGISRPAMADVITAVVAQKLIKTLCPHCRKIVPVSGSERALLEPWTDSVPETVAHPVGCPKCKNTGYFGRTVVAEVITLDHAIADMVRAGRSVADMRSFIKQRGDHLIADHAIEKVRAHLVSPADVARHVLAGQTRFDRTHDGAAAPSAQSKDASGRLDVLLLAGEPGVRAFLCATFEDSGYEVTIADNIADALDHLDATAFDLIIADLAAAATEEAEFLAILDEKEMPEPVLLVVPASHPDAAPPQAGGRMILLARKPLDKQVLLDRAVALTGGR